MTQTVTQGEARPARRRSSANSTAATVGPQSEEAKALLASLDEQLEQWAEDHAEELDLGPDDEYGWSVQDRMLLQSIGRVVDRTVDLSARYYATEETALRRDLSGELRQLEKLLADLLQRVRNALPAAPPSRRSLKAAAAVNTRWAQDSART